MNAAMQDPNFQGQFNAGGPDEKNVYGGQQIAGATPSQADYGSVQNYADAAHQEARRYLDPQTETQDRRMAQNLINRGVDPNSPQGRQMMDQLGRQQADANNSAAFGAMGFGQGIQNQMAQQELANQGLAGQMQQALWQNETARSGQNLQKYGMDQNYALGEAGLANQFSLGKMGMENQFNLGRSGQDLQRYGMDLTNQFNMGGLDMARQGQDFNQMLGLEGIDFRNRSYNDSQGWRQQQQLMNMLGMGGPMQGNTLDPSGAFNTTIGSAANDKGIWGNLMG
jgi:hypothetical protein